MTSMKYKLELNRKIQKRIETADSGVMVPLVAE